jgi:hypothetical protein
MPDERMARFERMYLDLMQEHKHRAWRRFIDSAYRDRKAHAEFLDAYEKLIDFNAKLRRRNG